ncbi:MAG TPA: antitoxin [Mycobacteriales bacterium]|nr:antitoxin [Mycobacteriales bacterium]
MSVLDKVKGLLKGREQQAKQAVDKIGDVIDSKTKGKHHDKIEQAEQKVAEQMDKLSAESAEPTPAKPEAAKPEAAKAEPAKADQS